MADHTKLIARVFSPFFPIFFTFRWQDYGEGVQLLDDLCRQITQKERRKQVNNKFISLFQFNRILTFISLTIFSSCSPVLLLSLRYSSLKLSKDSELESARRHFETIDTFWGRPGTYFPNNYLLSLTIELDFR